MTDCDTLHSNQRMQTQFYNLVAVVLSFVSFPAPLMRLRDAPLHSEVIHLFRKE